MALTQTQIDDVLAMFDTEAAKPEYDNLTPQQKQDARDRINEFLLLLAQALQAACYMQNIVLALTVPGAPLTDCTTQGGGS